MKKMRKALAVLLVFVMALGVLPLTAFAGNGPSENGSIIFMLPEYNFSPDYPYSQIIYEGGYVSDDYDDIVSYDLSTNTLTLDNYNIPMRLSVVSMGDDFKIELIGENSLDNIYFNDPVGNGCSVYFVGNGSLVVNEERNCDIGIHFDACGQSRPTVSFGEDVNITINSGADQFGAIVKAEKVLDSDENPEPPVFVFENGQNVNVQKDDTLIFEGMIEGYLIQKMNGGYSYFGVQVSNSDDPDGLYTYTNTGYYDSEQEEWIQTGYTVHKIDVITDGVYEYDDSFESGIYETEEALLADYPKVTEHVLDENPATLNNTLTISTTSSWTYIYEDAYGNQYVNGHLYDVEEGESYNQVCTFEEIDELPGWCVITPVDGIELENLTNTGETIGTVSLRNDGHPSSEGKIIDKETPDGIRYTAKFIEDRTDPDNIHFDWHIYKFVYSADFDMWFQDFSFNNDEGEIVINPQDFETSEWNAFIYNEIDRPIEIKSEYWLENFYGRICEDGEGHCCAIWDMADLNDDETVLYDYEDRDGVIIFTENTTFDKANFTVNDDSYVAEGVHDYSILGQSLVVEPGAGEWEAYVNIVDNEGNRYTPDDVITIKAGEKKFFWFETDFENNPAHGITPYVGFSENDEHIWTLTPAGFKVTGGIGIELGYEGFIGDNSFGIEVDTTGMKVATEAPLYCWLYEFEGKFPGMEGFDWNSLTKTDEFVFTFAVAPNEGFNTFADGHCEYIENEETKTGLFKLTFDDGYYNWYYADQNGILQSGWQNIDGKWYYFVPNEYWMVFGGMVELDGKTYCFDENGARVSGFKKVNGKYYYFDANGVMLTGWQTIKNAKGVAYKYYFGTDGVMRTGWQNIKAANGKKYKYYFHTNGVMLTGWQTISGKKYYFHTNGVMLTGWQDIKASNGKTYKYYLGTDGVMSTGWQTIGGKKYYFHTNGVMLTNWQNIKAANGKTYKYYLGTDGVMRTGWQKIGGKKYYFHTNGVMLTGWQSIKNSKGVAYKYYFGTDGVMRTGWQSIKNSKGVAYKYYFGTDGWMRTGWQTIKNAKGVAYKYYFGTNGVMATGWQTIKNSKGVAYKYYFGTNGYMRTGWQSIKASNGKTYKYYFGTNGVMVANKSLKIGKKTYKFNKYGICTNY